MIKKVLIGLGIFIVLAAAIGATVDSSNQDDPVDSQAASSRCEDVPDNIMANINEGMNTEGVTFRMAQAVKSNDYVSAYFISGDLQGPGLEGEDDFATFTTNRLDETGLYMALDGVANEFSVFPDARTTDAEMTIYDDGVQESLDCLGLL